MKIIAATGLGWLPPPPDKVTPSAERALKCYAKLYHPKRPLTANRRAALTARLNYWLDCFDRPDAASYYDQLQRWREIERKERLRAMGQTQDQSPMPSVWNY